MNGTNPQQLATMQYDGTVAGGDGASDDGHAGYYWCAY